MLLEKGLNIGAIPRKGKRVLKPFERELSKDELERALAQLPQETRSLFKEIRVNPDCSLSFLFHAF